MSWWCKVRKYFNLLLMKYSEGRPGKARMFPECKYDRKPAPLPSPPQSGDLRLSLFLPGGKLTLISSAWNITNPITSANVNND